MQGAWSLPPWINRMTNVSQSAPRRAVARGGGRASISILVYSALAKVMMSEQWTWTMRRGCDIMREHQTLTRSRVVERVYSECLCALSLVWSCHIFEAVWRLFLSLANRAGSQKSERCWLWSSRLGVRCHLQERYASGPWIAGALRLPLSIFTCASRKLPHPSANQAFS